MKGTLDMIESFWPVSKGLVAYNCDEQKHPISTVIGRYTINRFTNIKLYGKTRMILNNVTKSEGGKNGATQKIWSMESMHCMTWATVLDFLNTKVYSAKETTINIETVRMEIMPQNCYVHLCYIRIQALKL